MPKPKVTPQRVCLPLDRWPAPDRDAWLNAIAPGDVFDDGGLAGGWAPHSKRKRIESYGRWLTFVANDGSIDEEIDPWNRVQPDLVGRFVEELNKSVGPQTVLCRIEDLHAVMRVMAPDRDWRWLRRIANRQRARVPRDATKDRRIRPSAELYAFGVVLMENAEQCHECTPVQRATRYRDGLQIALLAARPVRRRNLAGIVIGKNLIRTTGGYWLRFDGSETKNHRPIELPLPADLSGYLDRYLDHHRRVLLGTRDHQDLWVTQRGAPMASGSIYLRIVALTREQFGEPINPHLFRDCAATSVAIEDPEHVRISASILGHASLATTEKYYNQARTLEAGRIYQKSVVTMRREMRKLTPDRE